MKFNQLFETIKIELSDCLRGESALRVTSACLLAVIAACFSPFPGSYWTVISAFIVVQLTRAATVRKGLMLIAGTAAGCLIGFFSGLALSGHVYIIAVILTGWSFLLIYGARRGIYPHALLMAVITAYLVALSGKEGLENPGITGIARFYDVCIGVIIAWSLVKLWPINKSSKLLDNTGKSIKYVLNSSFELIEPSFSRTRHVPKYLINRVFQRQDYLLNELEVSEVEGYNMEQIQSISAPLRSLVAYADHFARTFGRNKDVSRYTSSLFKLSIFRQPFLFLDRLNTIPDRSVLSFIKTEGDSIENLKHLIDKEKDLIFRISIAPENIDNKATSVAIFFLYIMETISEIFDIASSRKEKVMATPCRNTEVTFSNFLSAGNVDRIALIEASKITLSIALASILWAAPSGNVHAAIFAAFVASLGAQTGSYKKLFFRVLGIVTGGFAASCYFLCFGYSALLPALLPLLAIFAFAYTGLGRDDWNYTGAVAGICFVLCVDAFISYHVPNGTALYRIDGIVLGGFAASLVLKFFFPFNYIGAMMKNGERLHSAYCKALGFLEGCFTGDAGMSDQFEKNRMEMRSASILQQKLSQDTFWDRIAFLIKIHHFKRQKESIYDIERHFFSLFSIVRVLPFKGPEIDLWKEIGQLLSDIRHTLESTQKIDGPVWREKDTDYFVERVDDMLAWIYDSEGDYKTEKKTEMDNSAITWDEALFFLRLFLFDLKILLTKFDGALSLKRIITN